ncbi:MAG: hypothetical protein AB7I68_13310 [Porticoccaceae bacterium]
MVRRALPIAILECGAAQAADTPPADWVAMQHGPEQLAAQVSALRSERDAERSARQKAEATAVIRPVSDGKSLEMQSPSGDFSFRVGVEARTAGARSSAVADSPISGAPGGGGVSTQDSMA